VRASYETISNFSENNSRVGIVEGYVYGSGVSMLLDNSKTSKYFVNAIIGEINVARLLDENIGGYLENSFVGASLLRRKALSRYIIAHGITIQTGSAYVVFSNISVTPEQLGNFSIQLQKIKNSRIYQSILTRN
jgi:polar amino acid transport system substrate-binding protein